MKNLHYEPTTKMPQIDFDFENGQLFIKGRAIPNHAYESFEPVVQWIEAYTKNPPPVAETQLTIQLEFFSTSAAMHIFNVLKYLNGFAKQGNAVKTIWYYEEGDDDMQEYGLDYQSILGDMQFEVKTY